MDSLDTQDAIGRISRGKSFSARLEACSTGVLAGDLIRAFPEGPLVAWLRVDGGVPLSGALQELGVRLAFPGFYRPGFDQAVDLLICMDQHPGRRVLIVVEGEDVDESPESDWSLLLEVLTLACSYPQDFAHGSVNGPLQLVALVASNTG